MYVFYDGNMYEIPRLVKYINRGKYTLKKNNHTQDSIYVIQHFAYVHGVAKISLFLGKNTECGNTVFLSQKQHKKTLISKTIFFISCT